MATAATGALVTASTNAASAYLDAPDRCRDCAWHSAYDPDESRWEQVAVHQGAEGHKVSSDFHPDPSCRRCGRTVPMAGGEFVEHSNLSGVPCREKTDEVAA